ncbi:MAG: HAD family hydrolase [Deltaproteobacteria bacterium]|nr:HAD family hydrolase [Deltaproteobacteria bacterium]
MLPRAVLFDLDDTLISFDSTTTPAWIETCALFAEEAGVPSDVLHQAISDFGRWYWSDPTRHQQGRLELEETRRKIVAEVLVRLDRPNEALACRITDHYSALQKSCIELYPDALDTLEFFKAKGISLALVTNGNAVMQRRKIDRFHLNAYFEHCFVEGELGYGKPDPRVFTGALDALKTAPHDTWCVGDNLVWDVAGAQACGIYGIWKAKDAKDHGEIVPDRIIHELRELTRL